MRLSGSDRSGSGHLSLEPGPTDDKQGLAPGPVVEGMTILAVENDRTHLVYLADVLRRLGYPVLAAAGHEEAMKLARENNGSVHMIVVNAGMSDGRAKPLWRMLSRLCPRARVLCMTEGGRVDLSGDIDILRKPLSLVDLVMKVDGAFRRMSEHRRADGGGTPEIGDE